MFKKGFAGVLSIPRKLYLSNPFRPSDVFEFDEMLRHRFPYYKYVKANNLNLRPWNPNRLEILGYYKKMRGDHWIKVLLWSIVRFKPKVFVGYLR